MSILTVNQMTQ